MRVVHMGTDPGVESGVVHVLQGTLPIHLGGLGGTDDFAGHNDTHVANPSDIRIEEAHIDLFCHQGLGHGLR